MHELHRFERKRTQSLDAEPHRLASQCDVGEAIDNRDHLHLAAHRAAILAATGIALNDAEELSTGTTRW